MFRVGLAKAALKPASLRPVLSRGIKTIPQPPGGVVGGPNDAYVPPPADKMHGSLHWTAERAVAIGLIPLTIYPFFNPACSIVDSSLCSLMLYHCYTGFQSCIIDYIPKRVYGGLHNAAMYLLLFGTGVAGYGIYEIEKKEGGVAGIIAKLWKA
ncbi:succinate dehydrogenase [ubiquinone] cytochrome b small subunit, mitochondrial [Diutina catenulata]